MFSPIRALVLAAAGIAFTIPGAAGAQSRAELVLSLPDAISLARESNPTYQSQRNDADAVGWEVRSAYGQLLPSATISGGATWQGAGEQQFGSLTFEDLGFGGQPSYLFSSYRLGLNWTLDGARLFAPGDAKARRTAAEERARGAADQLVLRVTQLYLDVLLQGEGVTLAKAQEERARYNLSLAQARQDVGVGLALDTRRAEVEVGRAEVAVLQAENAADIARIRLLQEIGIDVGRPLQLTTSFALEEPTWSAPQLVELAVASNPALSELRATRREAASHVNIARSAYFPTLSLNAGWSGFAREASTTGQLEARLLGGVENARQSCEAQNDLFARLVPPLPANDCSVYTVTEADLNAIRTENDQFPFDFNRSPPSVSLSLSLPLFQGFSRQQQVEAAQVAREDVDWQLRAQELGLRADVAANVGTVSTAYQSALIEERNQALADDQLRLARERYSVSQIPFSELVDAETVKAQADRDLIGAIFAFHDAIAQLEAIVGAPLR